MVYTQPKDNSVLHITERFHIYTPKKYNWFQKKLWRLLLNVEVEDL